MVIGIPAGIRNVNRQHASQALTSTVSICCHVKQFLVDFAMHPSWENTTNYLIKDA